MSLEIDMTVEVTVNYQFSFRGISANEAEEVYNAVQLGDTETLRNLAYDVDESVAESDITDSEINF